MSANSPLSVVYRKPTVVSEWAKQTGVASASAGERNRLITRNRTHFWCLGLLYVALRRHPLRSASTNPRSPGREVNRYELRNWNTGCGAEKASMPRLQQMRRKKHFLFASERSFKFTLTHSPQSYQKITSFFLNIVTTSQCVCDERQLTVNWLPKR